MQEIMQFVGRHPILSIAWIALLVAVLVTTFKSLTSKVKASIRAERGRCWLGWRKLASGARQIIYLSSFMMQAVSCN